MVNKWHKVDAFKASAEYLLLIHCDILSPFEILTRTSTRWQKITLHLMLTIQVSSHHLNLLYTCCSDVSSYQIQSAAQVNCLTFVVIKFHCVWIPQCGWSQDSVSVWVRIIKCTWARLIQTSHFIQRNLLLPQTRALVGRMHLPCRYLASASTLEMNGTTGVTLTMRTCCMPARPHWTLVRLMLDLSSSCQSTTACQVEGGLRFSAYHYVE